MRQLTEKKISEKQVSIKINDPFESLYDLFQVNWLVQS